MPGILKDLCAKALLDCVAMDIKAGRNHYEEAAGVSGLSMERIDESIEFLLSGSVPYEFRTTVVRGLHTSDDSDRLDRGLRVVLNTTCSVSRNPEKYLSPESIQILQRMK